MNCVEMRFNVAVPAGGQTQEEPLKKLRHNLKRRRSLLVHVKEDSRFFLTNTGPQ